MTIEAPQFIHTEAERAEMLTRMEGVAAKDEISAEELEKIAWLILDRDVTKEEEDYNHPEFGFDGDMCLPDMESPTIILGPAKKGEYFKIILTDVLSKPEEDYFTGEAISMDVDKERGSLRWRVGIEGSVYSEFLGRRVEVAVPSIKPAMTIDPLSPREHATLAKRLFEAYLQGLEQDFVPPSKAS